MHSNGQGKRAAPREIHGQAIEINHRGEPGILILILLHPQCQIPGEMLIVRQAAAKQTAVAASGGNAMSVRENGVRAEFRSEDLIHEAFFGLAFGKNVKADQCEGLPPTTFFSHNSESV